MSKVQYFFQKKAQTVLKSKIKHGGLTYDKEAKEDQKAWVSGFQHDLVIGKVYGHEDYENCRLERIIVNPGFEFKRHWLFWSKVRPTFTLAVVISYQQDSVLAAAGVITLEKFILGIKESRDLVTKFQAIINKLKCVF